MNRLSIYALFLFIVNTLPGQQTSLYSLHHKDPYRIIPAFAGMEGTLFSSVIYRNQWQGLEGNPRTLDLSINMPLYWLASGAGINISKDELGLSNITVFKPSWNKVIHSGELLWSVGLQLSYIHYSFNGALARTPDGAYLPWPIDHKDPYLSEQKTSFSLLDGGLSGVMLYKNYKIGLMVSNLLESKTTKDLNYWQNKRHYYVFIGGAYQLGNWTISPEVVVQSTIYHTQNNLFLGFDHNGSIFGGIHFRGYDDYSLESFGVSAGFRLSGNLSVAYVHEFYLGKLSQNPDLKTQEFGLFYQFGKNFGLGKKPRVQFSPRYFD